jgi:hypothetical protein
MGQNSSLEADDAKTFFASMEPESLSPLYDLELSLQLNVMKSSRAIGDIRFFWDV